MASIVDKKGDIDKIEIVGQEVDLGGLRGTLRVSFLSGAGFTVTWISSLVLSAVSLAVSRRT